jgi:hypothetical protein
MAKALAFRRDQSEVVTVDTINNALAALGAAIPNAELTDRFGSRTRNNVAIFLGDPYLLYRESTAGETRVTKYATGAWSDAAAAALVDPATGYRSPICLHVVQDQLVQITSVNQDGVTDEIAARRSADGAAWSAAVTRTMPTKPGDNRGGHSIVWRNAVWLATSDGLMYYDVAGDAFGPTFDTGSDSNITGQEALLGAFAFWNNDLYFVLPGAALRIYKLATSWGLASPPAPPAWTNVAATGIPSVGTFTPGPDVGAVCLLVGPADDALYLLYSAQLGTKMAKTTAADYPAFTDVTDPYIPTGIRAETNLGFAVFVDDRRSTAELMSLLLHDPTTSDTRLASWDGTTEIAVRTTFSSIAVMPPHERFGALRTYTALQPTCHVRSTTQPFPGRVEIDYTVRDSGSRPVDIFGEYSIDGDEWLSMTQGDGDDGHEQLASTPAGSDYTFYWDTWVDLDGTFSNMRMRIVARISGT